MVIDGYQQISTAGGERYPEAQEDLRELINKGALIVNYIGHGGEVGWASERILELSDINNLDHAVTAVGYGVDSHGHMYYIIKNSWGADWGMDGYIYFSRDIDNMCGIATDAMYPLV